MSPSAITSPEDFLLPRTRTIFHGIRVTSEGEALSSDADPPRIGYVGRLVTEKGIPVLFEAAKKLRDDGL